MSTRDVGFSLREAVRRNADGVAARTLTADGQHVANEASPLGRMIHVSSVAGMMTPYISYSSQICHVSTLLLSREKESEILLQQNHTSLPPCPVNLCSHEADELGGAGEAGGVVVKISGGHSRSGTRQSFGCAWAQQRRIPPGEHPRDGCSRPYCW